MRGKGEDPAIDLALDSIQPERKQSRHVLVFWHTTKDLLWCEWMLHPSCHGACSNGNCNKSHMVEVLLWRRVLPQRARRPSGSTAAPQPQVGHKQGHIHVSEWPEKEAALSHDYRATEARHQQSDRKCRCCVAFERQPAALAHVRMKGLSIILLHFPRLTFWPSLKGPICSAQTGTPSPRVLQAANLEHRGRK